MNKLNLAIALTIALPTAALAQQPAAHANHSAASGSERPANGNMTGCSNMAGDHAMDQNGAAHQGMSHQNASQNGAAHQGMNHQNMDRSTMNRNNMNPGGGAGGRPCPPADAE